MNPDEVNPLENKLREAKYLIIIIFKWESRKISSNDSERQLSVVTE